MSEDIGSLLLLLVLSRLNFCTYIKHCGGGGGVKDCRFYLVKRRLRGGEGVKNRRFWDDIVYGRPLTQSLINEKGLEEMKCFSSLFTSNTFTIFRYVLGILNFQISEKFDKDTIWPTLVKNPNAAPDRRKRPRGDEIFYPPLYFLLDPHIQIGMYFKFSDFRKNLAYHNRNP